jgi:hypothetical protein
MTSVNDNTNEGDFFKSGLPLDFRKNIVAKDAVKITISNT